MAPINPLNPPLAEGIRRLGFRKWYERELLSSHAHMALAVLGAVAMLACIEAFASGSPGEKLLDTALALISAGVTLWALKRYAYLLLHAEALANQANCPRCEAYGQLQLSQHPPRVVRQPDAEAPTRLVAVCCKRCRFEWDLNDA